MKATVERKEEKPKFDPVTLTLTFESQLEVDVFYQTFNYSPITEVQRTLIGDGKNMPEVICNAIRKLVNNEDIDSWVKHLRRT